MERAYTTAEGPENDLSIEPQADSPVQGRRRAREEATVASDDSSASPAREVGDEAAAAASESPKAPVAEAEPAKATEESDMGARASTLDTHQPRPTALSNYSTEHPQADREAPRGHRAQILRQPLRPAEETMFRMPITDWVAADRAKLGWRSSVARATPVSALKPLSVDVLTGIPGAEKMADRVRGKFYVFDGPVTALETDAIVNAANEGCMGGGGVDGAIHSAAGPLLMRECATFHGCHTGHTRITKGYALPARTVLHTVGPMGERPQELASCYKTCVDLGRRYGLRSIGFCCVSTGIFGYPLRNATLMALKTTITAALDFEGDSADPISAYVFACFKREESATYQSLFPKMLKRIVEERLGTGDGKQ